MSQNSLQLPSKPGVFSLTPEVPVTTLENRPSNTQSLKEC